jgi:hypothetical protein
MENIENNINYKNKKAKKDLEKIKIIKNDFINYYNKLKKDDMDVLSNYKIIGYKFINSYLINDFKLNMVIFSNMIYINI